MFEINIKVDDLDYANIIKVAFPVIKAKAQNETAMWAMVVKHINEPDEKEIEGILNLIPVSARDKLIKTMLAKYKEEIGVALTSLAEAKGLKLKIREVDFRME